MHNLRFVLQSACPQLLSMSHLRTLSFSVSCNPCICHSYENCRVCTNNSHFETRRRDFRHRNEKLVPANPLESAFANCDTCKSSRMRFYENCQVSLVSISSDLRFYLNFLPSVWRSSRRGFGHPHILVGGAVVKQEPIAIADHAFDEDDVGDLADFLPFLFRGEDGGIGAEEQFAGIAAVEDGDGGAIDKLIVGTVVDQDDAALGENRWGTGLDDARVKLSRAARKNRRGCGFGPVKEIGGIGEPHLVSLVGGSAKPVHPVFAVDFFGDDSARFRPRDIPISLVRRKYHALAFPVNQVAGRGKAKLRVFLVVAGVGEVEEVADFLQARVFDTAIFFVVGFGGEYRLGAAREMEAISAFGVAETRGAGSVLGAVKHHEFSIVKDHGRVKRSSGFPGCALRRKDGF